jgi:DNA-binding MarR family transcriptional regulator
MQPHMSRAERGKPNGSRRSDPLEELYGRPGFMIRRAHQIGVALFLEETGELRITTTQYGILYLLKHRPDLDQISVAKLLGLDRSTTGMVLKKLETAGLIGRSIGVSDRRRRSLRLTRAGEKMLERLAEPARRVRARQLAAFEPHERTLFLQLLEKFTGSFNGSTRVPLLPHQARRKATSAGAGRPRAPCRQQKKTQKKHKTREKGPRK